MMEFPAQYQQSLTIPSGATTGERITINEDNSGEIRVYDNNGNLIYRIGFTPGTSGAAEAYTSDGKFATDYSGAGLTFLHDDGGGILTEKAVFGMLTARYIGWNTILSGGVALDDASGTLVHVDTNDTVPSWQNPTAATNWSVISAQYQLGITHNVQWRGRMDYTGTASAGAGGALVTAAIPSRYWPNYENMPVAIPQYTSGMVLKGSAAAVMRTDGVLQIYWNNGIATGDRFYLNNLDVTLDF